MLRSVRRSIAPHGLILMYHRVALAACDPWQLCVSPENFAQHLDVLRRQAELVPLSRLPQAVGQSRRGRLPVAITFDDGYADNHANALPILERHDAPATIFLATGSIGSRREFWSDRLARLVMGASLLPDPLTFPMGGSTFSLPTAASRRRAVLDAVWRRMRALPEAAREEALRELGKVLRQPERTDDGQLAMTAEQVAAISDRGLVSIGAHTRSHCLLTSLSPQEQCAEIAASKADCEALTGKPATELAYPYGWYDGASLACARQAGFDLACTTVPQPVTRRSAAHALPRYAVPDIDGERLARFLWLRLRAIGSKLAPAV